MDYTETSCKECGVKIFITPGEPQICDYCEDDEKADQDSAALDTIAQLLSDRKLCSLAPEVAEIVVATGRKISEPYDD